MTALYRKYRPQDFDEVVGQEAVVRTLRNAIERDQVRQAYLFAGPRGTGKTSMARIVAKALNCVNGPTASPCGECNSCRTIAAGTSLDVVEMDAASQRGIDDIREIRDHVILQPVEGRYKVYILDEAHQLTDAAFNALLKLIEEPPPHLVFIFCTTDLSKMLPTVRSRCQTFRFERPRLGELTRVLRVVADGEGIQTTDAALSLVARSARGSFRDAVSTLDQLASSTAGDVSVPAVLELLGAIDDDALFRLLDLVVDQDTAGLLTFVEELADQGHDMGRLVTDLLEHLRHLMLVQHMGGVPDSIPVTDDARERLRTQASQLGATEVLRLVDLLAVAVEDMRQGGDPRLPLELALVKVTQPEHDPSREALLQRIERLEVRGDAARCRPRRHRLHRPATTLRRRPYRESEALAGPLSEPPAEAGSETRRSTSTSSVRPGTRQSSWRSRSARFQRPPSCGRRVRHCSRRAVSSSSFRPRPRSTATWRRSRRTPSCSPRSCARSRARASRWTSRSVRHRPSVGRTTSHSRRARSSSSRCSRTRSTLARYIPRSKEPP